MTTTLPAIPRKKTFITQDGQRVGYTLDNDGDGVADTVTYKRATRGVQAEVPDDVSNIVGSAPMMTAWQGMRGRDWTVVRGRTG